MRVSKIVEMDLGDLLDGDAYVTADVTKTHVKLLHVRMTLAEREIDLVNELTESARDRLIEEISYSHDVSTSEPEDMPGVDR